MQKTNRNFKRIKFIKKMIIFAVVQVLIITAFCIIFSNIVTDMDGYISEISGIPDEVKVKRHWFSVRYFYDVKCVTLYFDDLELNHTVYVSKLSDKTDTEIERIFLEKTLYITYFEEDKKIVEMYNEDTVFTTAEDYYKRYIGSDSAVVWRYIIITLILIFIESVYCIALWLNISTDWNDVKPKKKRNKAKKKTQKTADDSSS